MMSSRFSERNTFDDLFGNKTEENSESSNDALIEEAAERLAWIFYQQLLYEKETDGKKDNLRQPGQAEI